MKYTPVAELADAPDAGLTLSSEATPNASGKNLLLSKSRLGAAGLAGSNPARRTTEFLRGPLTVCQLAEHGRAGLLSRRAWGDGRRPTNRTHMSGGSDASVSPCAAGSATTLQAEAQGRNRPCPGTAQPRRATDE